MTVIEHAPSEVTTKTREEILRDAATLIEERGWTVGSKGMPWSEENDGSLCLLGAIVVAAGRPPEWCYDEPARIVDDSVDWMDVTQFNDRRSGKIPLMSELSPYEQEVGMKRVTTTLRRLADGASWEEATA